MLGAILEQTLDYSWCKRPSSSIAEKPVAVTDSGLLFAEGRIGTTSSMVDAMLNKGGQR